ncbi:hypothetical protein PVAP13_1NG132657 [Panicum virgatum]|uniref:Uncharacterized protein n=1 Tax=Panicum virgatum TaxID=38727 RepID=A0A8T0WXE9_PANVG|nr:hypothetical protein PVAP13_1NG132657 [Panicum virgatum]
MQNQRSIPCRPPSPPAPSSRRPRHDPRDVLATILATTRRLSQSTLALATPSRSRRDPEQTGIRPLRLSQPALAGSPSCAPPSRNPGDDHLRRLPSPTSPSSRRPRDGIPQQNGIAPLLTRPRLPAATVGPSRHPFGERIMPPPQVRLRSIISAAAATVFAEASPGVTTPTKLTTRASCKCLPRSHIHGLCNCFPDSSVLL